MGRGGPVQLRDRGAVPRGYAPRAERSHAQEEGAPLAAVLVQGTYYVTPQSISIQRPLCRSRRHLA